MPKKENIERDNPCLKEQELTYKCLNTNNYDKEKCEKYFNNYNNCKEFWNNVKSYRRAKGLVPIMPDVEDRASIKAEFLKQQNK